MNSSPLNKNLKLHSFLDLFFIGITFALLLSFCADFFILSFQYLKYPYEIDYGEGCGLTFLTHLKTYGTYFFDINDYPFSYATYPPVFMLITWAVNLVVPSGLMAARLVSIAATCLLILVLYLLLWNRTKDRLLSLLSALSFLGIWFVRLWAPLGRIDMVVCLFTLTGLFCFQVYQGSRKRYWAFFFFVLAFFTKQNAVLAPAAVLLYALIRKEQRKYFFSYLAAYLIPIAILFSLLNLYTHGEAFKHLFLLTAQRSMLLSVLVKGINSFCISLSVLLLFIFSFVFLKKKPSQDDLVYWLYLLLNVFSLPAIGMTGSNLNYFIEPAISIILIAAIISYQKLQEVGDYPQFRARYFMIIATVFAQAFISAYISGYVIEHPFEPFIEGARMRNHALKERLDRAVKNSSGDILCEDLSLLEKNKKPVFLGCSYPLAEQGLWNPERLIRDCQNGRFQYIFSQIRFWLIPKLRECMEGPLYETQESIFYFTVRKLKKPLA